MTIFVSAGHGPVDPGVVYQNFGEHAEACRWRDEILRVGNLLGVPFEGVPEVNLMDKVSCINRRIQQLGGKHHIAIEIHFNAGGTPGQTRGSETLYAPGSSRGELLAQIVQEAVTGFFPPSRGVKEAWYRQDHPHRVDYAGDADGDEKPDYFCVKTVCPAVILEPEFIYERTNIQSKREAACRSIAAALVNAHQVLSKTA